MEFGSSSEKGKQKAFFPCKGPEPGLETEREYTQVTSPDEFKTWLTGPSKSKKFHENQDEIQKYCLKLAYSTKNDPDPKLLADEIFNETCYRIVEKLAKETNPIPNIAGYMKTTAHNYWVNVTRNRNRMVTFPLNSIEELDEEEFLERPGLRKTLIKKLSTNKEPIDIIIENEFYKAISDALSKEEQHILEEYIFSEHGSKQEVANSLGLSLNALYQKIARIKKKAKRARQRFERGYIDY